MTSLWHVRPAVAAIASAAILLVTACSSSSTGATAEATVAASSVASSVASSAAESLTASEPAPVSEPLTSPCDLLTLDQISVATGVTVPDGSATTDDARQIQMCTWQSTDPFLIVAASLTDVAADEAFKTNVDLAPAYFDGDPVTITLPGADKAYAVQQPDVGWVVGAVAKGRFVQVQVGGSDITQEQAATLVQDAIARMPSEG